MDYKKIRLNNERSTHVVKRLNRLSTWKFFGVLYRDNMMRLFGFSLMMLLCIAPIFVVQYVSAWQLSSVKQTLPLLNGFGLGGGVWTGANDYYSGIVSQNNAVYGAYTVLAAALCCLIFSGGFAVIRDAFWTGSLSTVGVFRSLGKGIAAGILYALVSTLIIAGGIYGIFMFCAWAVGVMATWLAVVLTILLSAAMLLVVCYLMILCSVAVTYKQTVAENLDDSWRLLWLNILPNILHLLFALLPIPIYLIVNGGAFQMLFLAVMFLLGGMYFPLVWQTHMMKTFALFHPVEVKKKKDVRREQRELEEARKQASAEKHSKKK